MNSSTPKLALCIVVLCTIPAGHSSAQDLLDAEAQAFHQAVSTAQSCAVQIETFGTAKQSGGELVAQGPTTGTILSEDGLIVTSLFSFRSRPASILVTLPDGQRRAAEILARDHSRELVLLKVDAQGLPTPRVAPKSETAVGQWAIALGKTYDSRTASRSVGIVSALGRAHGRAIQTDAKISPINYGGPLIDIDGRVMGILSPIPPGAFLEGDSSELYDSGIGFAIPLEDVMRRLPAMASGNDLHPGLLGIVVQDQNDFASPVVISGASPGTPAAQAGLQSGDTIISGSGIPIHMYSHLKFALAQVDAGETFEFTVLRDGKEVAVSCVLAEELPVYYRRHLGIYLAATTSAKESGPDKTHLSENTASENADSKETARNKSTTHQAGLRILGVVENSPADKASIKPGDTLSSLGPTQIKDLDEMRQALAVAELSEPIALQIDSGSQTKTVELLPQEWPAALPTTLPNAPFEPAEDAKCTSIDIKLGDFPNDCFAVLPPAESRTSPGILIAMSAPGELDRDKTLAYWNDFCRNYGWVVVVINSKDPKSWSREELELPRRVLVKLDSSYHFDPSRIVVAGFGVGGRMALGAASESKRFTAVMTLGTQVGRFSIRRRNSPQRSLHFLFAGNADANAKTARQLRSLGYDASTLVSSDKAENNWDAFPADILSRWLVGLGRL